MGDIYFYMLIILAGLAITDLVVGVSNDAVNFLNSAIGSKAVSFRTLMIVASIGIAFGAFSSSGMMEVAKSSIFNPQEFYFNEIMIIFMAVMITDVLLLDFFNTLGLPTSTTVSIVFELLGAAVAVALIKIYSDGGSQNLTEIGRYIASEEARKIVISILLSVVMSFSVGAFVQFLSRLMLTFNYNNRPAYLAGVFGGLSLTSLYYFILVKGLKGSDLGAFSEFLATTNTYYLLLGGLGFWTVFSFLYVYIMKWDIYKLIIIMGTFGLAMAFAGNDLVNFIGVPMGAYDAYNLWTASGSAATDFTMGGLLVSGAANKLILAFAGLVMVLTLWFSSKAQSVVKTSVDLARQDSRTERFQSNELSRVLVRYTIKCADGLTAMIPESVTNYINSRFEKLPELNLVNKNDDKPAFDYVRASVNLMVASILISFATASKLPLSTTYVTFMVAMGTSLADRAWGSDTAVYRIAGVINVIGGWFMTAIVAFTAAAVMAYIIYLGGMTAIVGLVLLAIFLLFRSQIAHKKSKIEQAATDEILKAESSTIQGILDESSNNIATVLKRSKRIYKDTLDGLIERDLVTLKRVRKESTKLDAEVEGLRNNIFYFIRNLDEKAMGASKFYINLIGNLQDVSQSLEYIAKSSDKHINNNHKSLKFKQTKDLKEVVDESCDIFDKAQSIFKEKQFNELERLIMRMNLLVNLVNAKIDDQVARTKDKEETPKNTTLYFAILLETRDLIHAFIEVATKFYTEYDARKTDL
ncbi:MAG: inorganic phosphate transporter [Nonlabens sp.]|nr:inorganic phosphate transporter [Nonlabens sp.]